MVGKEPPSDLSHCCSLLLLYYPARELLADPSKYQELCRALAKPQRVPGAGCPAPARAALPAGRRAQHLPVCWVLAAAGQGCGGNPRPTCLVHITLKWARVALSSCNPSRDIASISPWGNSRTTLQVKANRPSSRAAGKRLQLAPYPLHRVASTDASS